MGKKQKEQSVAQRLGTQANSKKGGIAGQQNALAAKNQFSIVDGLKAGRHECLCQARIHELVLNCLGCGRIVCAQEGSGPCFTCGTLVCTREEREILNRNSKKSAELMTKLIENGNKSYQEARNFRDKLLEADADTERRTHVNDLQSDYSNLESSPFINAEERAALKQRREELRRLRETERKRFTVAIDVDQGIVQQMKNCRTTDSDIGKDPIIQQIMESADERRRAQDAAHNSAADARWNPIGFVPRYLVEDQPEFPTTNCSDGDIIDAESLMIVSDEIRAQITEEKGWTIGVKQPEATFLANGLIKCILWKDHISLIGPIFIAAKTGEVDEAEINKFAKKYVQEVYKSKNVEFADGALLGRAFLNDCLHVKDYMEVYGSTKDIPGDGEYVLMFNGFEPFSTVIPHIPNGEMYELDRQLKRTVINW